MFAPPPFEGPNSYPLDAFSDPATMSATKRPRVAEALRFEQLDLSKVTFNQREVDKKTYEDILLDGDIPHLNLTPGTSLDVKFGFDMTGTVEKRSFHPGAKVEPQPNESLSLAVSVGRELEEVLQRLDDHCRELCTAFGVKGEWVPLLSHPYPQFRRYAKLRVGLKGDCAELRIHDDGELKQGSGWEFLRTCEASVSGSDGFAPGFSYAKVKASVKLRLWKTAGTADTAGKCGISMAPVYLIIKPQPRPKLANPFADDNEF